MIVRTCSNWILIIEALNRQSCCVESRYSCFTINFSFSQLVSPVSCISVPAPLPKESHPYNVYTLICSTLLWSSSSLILSRYLSLSLPLSFSLSFSLSYSLGLFLFLSLSFPEPVSLPLSFSISFFLAFFPPPIQPSVQRWDRPW